MEGFREDIESYWGSVKHGAASLYIDLKELANPIISTAMIPVEKVKEAAREWIAQYNDLRNIDTMEMPAELLKERKSLLHRGQSVIDKIKTLGFGVDTLSGQMGLIPLVVGGAISVVAGLMMYWTADYLKFMERWTRYESLISKGFTHKNAMDTINGMERSSTTDNLKDVVKYVGVIGLGYVAYQFAKKQKWIK